MPVVDELCFINHYFRSGSLVYWEYRSSRGQGATVVEWGGPEEEQADHETNVTDRPPRLLMALSALHDRLGSKPWTELVQPAIDLARFIHVHI